MTERPETVLLVDDEESIVDMYDTWLEPEYDTRTATGGPAALSAMDDDVDLVVIDRRMPRRNGDEVVAELREAGHEVPVVMASAVPPDTDVVDAPIDSYLTKPVSREELTRAVDAALLTAGLPDRLREYYANAIKRSMLEATKLHGELRTSEAYRSLLDALDDADRSGASQQGRVTNRLTAGIYRDLEP